MFDVGFWEVTLIAVVALVVVGPERLPGLARTVGLYVGKMRRYADHIRREIEREVPAREFREMVDSPAESLAEVKSSIQETKDALTDTRQMLDDTEKELNTPDDEITAETKQKFAEAGKAILEQTEAASPDADTADEAPLSPARVADGRSTTDAGS